MTLNHIFEAFNGKNILVIGDVMLDEYLEGRVSRISPEAPVPIVDICSRYSRLGGAANVALNIKALGANPILCSVIGRGDKSAAFEQQLHSLNMSDAGIVSSENRKMTVKYRVLGNNTQLLRLDDEMRTPLNEQDYGRLMERISALVQAGNVAGIVFEDYDKGVISPRLINEITALAGRCHIPVTVDPKKNNFLAYHHVDVFKPNWKEMKEGLGLKCDKPNADSIAAIKAMMEQQHFSMVMLTLSEDGVMLLYREHNEIYSTHMPTRVRKVADVSGAGDTMIAVATLALVAGANPRLMVALANMAGGLVCEQPGVVAVNKQLFLAEAVKDMQHIMNE